MAESLVSWVPKVEAQFPGAASGGYGAYRSEMFLRDPVRPIIRDDSVFVAPADGVILYQRVIDADGDSIDVKGKPYTLRTLLEDPRVTGKALVIGIFMTIYDVHVNRIPYSGILSYRCLDPILSANRPMDPAEDDIMARRLHSLSTDLGGFLRYNARTVNSIYIPALDYRYWVTQIADDDVDVIAPFNPQQQAWVHQGMRFSLVRWGSMVELVLPVDPRYSMQTLVPYYYHVEAGIDGLVKIVE